MLALWNKLHFEEEKTESIYHVSNIQYLYLLNKYIKWNFRGQRCGTTTILFFLILAHPVDKMRIIQEPNTLELWNKMHFKEEKTESIYRV